VINLTQQCGQLPIVARVYFKDAKFGVPTMDDDYYRDGRQAVRFGWRTRTPYLASLLDDGVRPHIQMYPTRADAIYGVPIMDDDCYRDGRQAVRFGWWTRTPYLASLLEDGVRPHIQTYPTRSVR
jgi:hypothetical protein